MKPWIYVTGVFLLLLASVAGRSAFAGPESHIYFDNSSRGYVWVTAYSVPCDYSKHAGQFSPCIGEPIRAEGAWCVLPGSFDKHGLRATIYEVRAEVSLVGCQHHPVLLNKLRGFPKNGASNTMTYYMVNSEGGGFTYGNR